MATNKVGITDQDRAAAQKSWIPFLVMVIIGDVLISVFAILFYVSFPFLASSVPEQVSIGATLQIIAWIVFAIGMGLFCPGAPLMIVTIVKKSKARKKIAARK